MAANNTNVSTADEGNIEQVMAIDNPLDYALPLAVVQICLVVFFTRTLAFLLQLLHQPKVIAEIILLLRLYTWYELKLNGIDTLSLLSPVDVTLGQIERNLRFAAGFGGLSAWVGFGLNLLEILLLSLGILSLWTVNQINLSFPSQH